MRGWGRHLEGEEGMMLSTALYGLFLGGGNQFTASDSTREKNAEIFDLANQFIQSIYSWEGFPTVFFFFFSLRVAFDFIKWGLRPIIKRIIDYHMKLYKNVLTIY